MRLSSRGCTPAFSPDGRHFAVGCNDGTVKIWATHSGKLLKSLDRACHRCVGPFFLSFYWNAAFRAVVMTFNFVPTFTTQPIGDVHGVGTRGLDHRLR